jgi:hypothetical protein
LGRAKTRLFCTTQCRERLRWWRDGGKSRAKKRRHYVEHREAILALARQKREERLGPRLPKRCAGPNCDAVFTPHQRGRLYCSRRCAQRAHYRRHPSPKRLQLMFACGNPACTRMFIRYHARNLYCSDRCRHQWKQVRDAKKISERVRAEYIIHRAEIAAATRAKRAANREAICAQERARNARLRQDALLWRELKSRVETEEEHSYGNTAH